MDLVPPLHFDSLSCLPCDLVLISSLPTIPLSFLHSHTVVCLSQLLRGLSKIVFQHLWPGAWFIVKSQAMLELALVISLESVKCVEDSEASRRRGCRRSESTSDVFGVGVASFASALSGTHWLPIKFTVTHGLKMPGEDKGTGDLLCLGMLQERRNGIGEARESLPSFVFWGDCSQKLRSLEQWPTKLEFSSFLRLGSWVI